MSKELVQYLLNDLLFRRRVRNAQISTSENNRIGVPAFAFLSILVMSSMSYASEQLRESTQDQIVSYCGRRYADPIARGDYTEQRACAELSERRYKPQHQGIGFEILDSESQACFIPDAEYQLLDEIVDAVDQRVKYDPNLKERNEKIAQARRISTAISDVLAAQGFELYIPTTTLGEALLARDTSGGKASHIFDCDTGSFIFLTVAEYLKAPVALVEITLPSGDGHNYVRWRIDDQTSFDWDLNGRSECTTPPNLPSYQGKSMSRSQTLGYALTLRAAIWERRKQYPAALSDFRTAMSSYPESPTAYNNFAWLIATTSMPGEAQLSQEATVAANRAVSIDRSANNLDTLACVYALRNDFDKAANYEREASAKDPDKADFKTRLTSFTSSKPSNCIGAK